MTTADTDVARTETGEDKLRVGTLEYTKRGLVMVFFWLLWGDFCFTIMESVIPSVLPFTLRNHHASNLFIGLIITTIPAILNATICPWVSFKSDRHRSKWGRRIPFLLFPTPWIALFLVLLGFAPDIGSFLARSILAGSGIGRTSIILALFGVLTVGFQYFNMFVGSVYYYLFNDVVPETYIARFMALFRVVGTLAGAAFKFFVFPYAETHTKAIFVGAGILYFVVFTLMCMRIKEGEYPPPPENIDGKKSPLSSIKTYFVECYSHRFYWFFFLATTSWAVTSVAIPFNFFLQQKSLGLTLRQIGTIDGTAAILVAILLYPAGMLSDKKHPLRTLLIGSTGMALLYPLRLVYLFVDLTPQTAYRVEFALVMVLMPLIAISSASGLPTFMRLLPAQRYGQYCAAEALVRSAAMIVTGVIAGALLDLMKGVTVSAGKPDFYYYRFVPAWTWFFHTIGLVLMFVVYKYWKHYGGDKGYQAPAIGCVAGRETADVKTELL